MWTALDKFRYRSKGIPLAVAAEDRRTKARRNLIRVFVHRLTDRKRTGQTTAQETEAEHLEERRGEREVKKHGKGDVVSASVEGGFP